MFTDLQVNGYAGTDFNQNDLTPDAFDIALRALKRDGVESFLPTIITERLDLMYARLSRLAELRSDSDLAKQLIPGFHVEGPFISPVTGYVGAHPKDAVLPATPDAIQKLLEAGEGLVKLVTLAPEHDDGLKTIKLLAKNNVTISAGHCDPSLDQLKSAVDEGLTLFTHLGNGCPPQMHRHDNILQRALSLVGRGLTPCFIADGTHLPFFLLKTLLKVTTLEHAIVVTDCIAPASLGPGRYTLGRWDLLIEDDMVARSPDRSHFVGSAITMPQTLKNLTTHLGLTEPDALRLLHHNPRRALRFPH
jgi:N-acetylglucosamine-6-phosphate deacetylase